MSKVNLNNLATLQNEQSAINIINTNNDAVEAGFDNTISRDGTTPNQMNSELDMNSNHIINLPAPAADNDPVRLIDITSFEASGDGNVTSLATVTGGELVQYSGSSGEIITNYGSTGLVKTTSGIPSVATAGTDYYAPGEQVIPLIEGGTGQTTALAVFNDIKQSSTDTYQGVVELATTTEANAGIDTTRAVTAAGVKSYYDGHISASVLPYSKIIRTSNAQSGTSYTFALTDSGNVVSSTSSSATTFTIPNDSTVSWGSVVHQIDLIQFGSGKLSIAAGSGVTIVSASSFKSLSGIYTAATLLKVDANTWLLFGNITS